MGKSWKIDFINSVIRRKLFRSSRLELETIWAGQRLGWCRLVTTSSGACACPLEKAIPRIWPASFDPLQVHAPIHHLPNGGAIYCSLRWWPIVMAGTLEFFIASSASCRGSWNKNLLRYPGKRNPYCSRNRKELRQNSLHDIKIFDIFLK